MGAKWTCILYAMCELSREAWGMVIVQMRCRSNRADNVLEGDWWANKVNTLAASARWPLATLDGHHTHP